jgi:hypothetical protein
MKTAKGIAAWLYSSRSAQVLEGKEIPTRMTRTFPLMGLLPYYRYPLSLANSCLSLLQPIAIFFVVERMSRFHAVSTVVKE